MNSKNCPLSQLRKSPGDYPSAGLGRRFAAMIYDGLLLIAISIAYYALAVLINVLLQGAPPVGQKIHWGDWQPLVFAGWLGALMFFYCFFWRKFGQTLGMRAWRLKVINQQGSRLPLAQCVSRCVFAVVSLGFFGLGYFWRWLDPQELTLHDKLSKTRVLVLPKEEN